MINARVNEKLSFARLSLNAADNADHATQAALLEATLFHLVVAYRCYLQEVTDTQSTKFLSAVELSAALQPSGNFEELLILERRPSWLSQLLAAYDEVIALSTKDARSTGLVLVDVSASLDTENCREWLRQLQQLIERQREHAQEW
jgi:hypothetical protein